MKKIAVYATLAILAGVLALSLLSAIFLDRFLKYRVTKTLEETYPEYLIQIAGLQYGILENRLDCDSIKLIMLDSTFVCSIEKFTVNGIGRVSLLLGGGVGPDHLISSNMVAENIVMTFPRSQYELRCQQVHVSVPDSVVVIDSLELHPIGSDEQFFAASNFSKTRYRLMIPYCSVMGSACLGMLEGKIHCARIAHIPNAHLDILMNKDKPSPRDTVFALTPITLLSSIMKIIQLDSLNIINGKLTYGERFVAGAKPALITFDSVQVLAEGSLNRMNRADTVKIRGQWRFMQAGIVNVFVSIPLDVSQLSFRYSGSVSRMHLTKLNPFIEISDRKRFKTGILHSAAFDINVTNGRAHGVVRATYKDLKIVVIDDRTGSESGFGNTIASFFANNIKLRTSNMPDESGSMKIGEVKYTRKSDEAFLKFSWLALRGGFGDIVGF